MIPQSFHQDWYVFHGLNEARAAAAGNVSSNPITLPHDAMIHEKRTPDTPNQAQTGFYPGGQYVYQKHFFAPDEWRGKCIKLEFEGVYQTAQVYLNNTLVAENLYGYSNFFADLSADLRFGEENLLRVIADNSAYPNSRWYSGSGMYRGVRLWVGGPVYFPEYGIQITTLTADSDFANVEIKAVLRNSDRICHRVCFRTSIGETEVKAQVSLFPQSEETLRLNVDIPAPRLWSPDAPNLYKCYVSIRENEQVLDQEELKIGLRELHIDAARGVRINNVPTKLRGACIHHDNGILGAATWKDAEYRRCRQLKEAGFNAIRSSHHPISREMLEACDELGMLVMDELTDAWTQQKNPHDISNHFSRIWPDIIRRMIQKDYNHPSVILYSLGNEITEVASPRGCQLAREMNGLIHELDPTRYSTNGINGLVAGFFGGHVGLIMKELLHTPSKSGSDNAGSNAVNGALSLMEGEIGDRFATHPVLTEILEECTNTIDVLGLNYLTGRHMLEHKLHPHKPIVGTETFPADIVRLWGLVKRHPHILGDFTWAGYDYLGEAGCGIFHYDDGANFSSIYPERTANIGDLDLLGSRRPVSYLREIVYGIREAPYIAVERVDRYAQPHSKTPWMLKDNIASWTWPGYEGKPANVDVYSSADEVELLLNGRSLGRRPAGESCGFTASFAVTYEPGELTAVSYVNQQETGRHTLLTAGPAVAMQARVERGQELSFVTVSLMDAEGRVNQFDTRVLQVQAQGELLAFGSANPCSLDEYDEGCCNTYQGHAMAVLRGHGTLSFCGEGLAPFTVSIE